MNDMQWKILGLGLVVVGAMLMKDSTIREQQEVIAHLALENMMLKFSMSQPVQEIKQ